MPCPAMNLFRHPVRQPRADRDHDSTTSIAFIAAVGVTVLPAAWSGAIAMATATATVLVARAERQQPLLIGRGTDLFRRTDGAVITNKISDGTVRDAALFS